MQYRKSYVKFLKRQCDFTGLRDIRDEHQMVETCNVDRPISIQEDQMEKDQLNCYHHQVQKASSMMALCSISAVGKVHSYLYDDSFSVEKKIL